MRWWEWAFPIAAVGLAAWATIPDLAHFCGWLEWSRFCGLGAIVRFDVLLPLLTPLVFWFGLRTTAWYRRGQILDMMFRTEARE